MTLLDTSAIIDYLVDGELAQRVEDLLGSRSAALSAISVFELLAGVKSEKHLRERRELTGRMHVVPVTASIADLAGELFTRMRASGYTVDNEDLIVAATAREKSVPVLTANVRHFEHVPGITLA